MRRTTLVLIVLISLHYLGSNVHASGIMNPPFFSDTNVELTNFGAIELKCNEHNCIKKLGVGNKAGDIKTILMVKKYKFDRSVADNGFILTYTGNIDTFFPYVFVGLSISCSYEPAFYTFSLQNREKGEFSYINAESLLRTVEIRDCKKQIKSLWVRLLSRK